MPGVLFKGLDKAKEEGFFSEIATKNDFSIVRIIIGYELTGAIEIASEIKNLKVIAVD